MISTVQNDFDNLLSINDTESQIENKELKINMNQIQ